jgi:hypothetical protein
MQAVLFCLICLAGRGGAQTVVDIHAIQNDLPNSPYLYSTTHTEVQTTGIVIAVLSDGFYIENPTSDFDSNTCTSEGIYVYTGSGSVPSNAVLGYSVTVTGKVVPSNDSSYAGTQIDVDTPIATYVVTQSTGNTLPSAISSSVMTAATSGTCSDYSDDTFGQWLPFEGMRVDVPSSSYLLVAGGTGGTVTPTTQTAKTNGQFWAVFTDTDSASERPFRATGISDLETAPTTAPSTVTRWSGNPQLLLVDTTTLGGTALNAAAGTVYTGSSDMVGIVDYHVSTQGYTGLLLTSDTVGALSQQSSVTPVAAATPSSGQYTLATQELESSTGVGLTASETARIAKLAEAIVDYEHSPEILAVQGASSAAQPLLVSAISSKGGPSYTLSTLSTADASGYVNAFLIESGKFDGIAVSQALASTTYTTTSSTTATLFGRCPLVLKAKIARKGTTDYSIYVVNASLLDRTNVDSSSLGANVRRQRELQAQTLAQNLLEGYESSSAHVFVVGGFNSFEFSDGYVDALGIVDGLEATNTSNGSLVTLYDSVYNTTKLDNTTTTATNQSNGATNAASDRYTYVESGSAEQPDHILITAELADLVAIDYARFGADFPVSESYDATTVARAASHDGVLAYLTIPYPSATTLTSSKNPSYYGNEVTFTATVTSENGTPTGTVTFYDGSTALCTETLSSGVATCSSSSLTVGKHTIKAYYGGGAAYDTSSASLTQTVKADVTTLKLGSSENPSYYGDKVTFTLSAAGSNSTPTGTVVLYDQSAKTTLGTVTLTAGTATLAISTLSVGTHKIQASYAGDSANAAATASLTQVVKINTTTLTLSSGLNPSYYGSSVTFTAKATGKSGTPAGTILFYDGSSLIGSGALSSGAATYTTSTLSVGTHTIKATYAGYGANASATSNMVKQVVNSVYATVSTLVCSPNPASYGAAVTCKDAVASTHGTPAGTVTFYDGTASLGTATLSGGVASYTTSSLSVGSHSISAVYAGLEEHKASTSNTVAEIIVSSFALTASPAKRAIYTGEAASYTVTVTPKTGFTLPVGLSCSGTPANTTCTLTPAEISGGSGSSKLVVQTTAPSVSSGSVSGGTPPGSYTVTITGVAVDGTITVTKTATVTLVVESLF